LLRNWRNSYLSFQKLSYAPWKNLVVGVSHQLSDELISFSTGLARPFRDVGCALKSAQRICTVANMRIAAYVLAWVVLLAGCAAENQTEMSPQCSANCQEISARQ
jgi:hypothetical protein